MSASEAYRKQGNLIYSKAENTKKNISCALYQSKLEKAMKLYNDSIKHAVSSAEKASAYKNLGVVQTHYANSHNIKFSEEERKLMVFYYIESFQNLVYSLTHGKEMESEWTNFTQQLLCKALNGLIDGAKLLDKTDLRLSWLRCVKSKLSDLQVSQANIGVCTEMIVQMFHIPACEIFFNCAINAHEANDYCLSSRLFHECQQYLQFARYLGEKYKYNMPGSKQILDDLEERIVIHQCIIRSIQMRQKAEKMQLELLDNAFSDGMPVDKIWDIVDLYVEAGLAARDKDMEQEAIAAAKIVVVFDKILKLNLRTLHYARHMHSLCESMKPRSFHGNGWHDTALSIYQRVQTEEALAKQTKEDEEREILLAPIRPAIEKIKEAANRGAEALLIHLYQFHPPKSGEQIEQPINKETIVKRLKKSFLHYHSDKQVTYDKQWQALASEITKHLNEVYGKTCNKSL